MQFLGHTNHISNAQQLYMTIILDSGDIEHTHHRRKSNGQDYPKQFSHSYLADTEFLFNVLVFCMLKRSSKEEIPLILCYRFFYKIFTANIRSFKDNFWQALPSTLCASSSVSHSSTHHINIMVNTSMPARPSGLSILSP